MFNIQNLKLKEIFLKLSDEMDKICDKDSAVKLYSGPYIELLKNAIINKDYNLAFHLENLAYGKLIKRFEYPEHYQSCFNISDNICGKIGKIYKENKKILSKEKSDENKILFFIHNIKSNMAHVEHFYNFICGLNKKILVEKKIQIDVIGFYGTPSIKLMDLKKKKLINIYRTENKGTLAQACFEICDFFNDHNYKKMIIIAVPEFVSFFSHALPNKVAWWTMKFIIDSFPMLKNHYAHSELHDKKIDKNGNFKLKKTQWTALKMPWPVKKFSMKKNNINENKITFFTLNRAEKINKIEFLEIVKKILNEIPNSIFRWTGQSKSKNEIENIKNFFIKNKLENRNEFMGWVNCETNIHYGDIFLDTMLLSGFTAGRAFAEGIPVVFDVGGGHWIQFAKHTNKDFSSNFDEDKLSKEIFLDWQDTGNSKKNANKYIQTAKKIVLNKKYREKYCTISHRLADKYFHINNSSEILEKILIS